MTWREPNIETMPGRILVGRPEGAKAHVATYVDLFKVCKMIADAWKKNYPDATEWQAHVIFLRASSRYAEQLVHVDLSRMDIGGDPATFLADRVAESIEMLRGANMAPHETLLRATEESEAEAPEEEAQGLADE